MVLLCGAIFCAILHLKWLEEAFTFLSFFRFKEAGVFLPSLSSLFLGDFTLFCLLLLL